MTKRILLVEDEDLLCDIYHEILTAEGYDVDVAIDGEQAGKFLSAGGYDLVLLDVLLPKRDGKQLMADLQQTPSKKPNNLIVWMTNLAEEGLKKEMNSLGVHDVMVKSQLTPEEFLNNVKKYLA